MSDTVAESARSRRRKRRRDTQTTISRRRVVALVVLGVLLLVAYIGSMVAYRAAIDDTFVKPDVPAGSVAVVLVPTAVNGANQLVDAEVLLFPGSQFLADDTLTQDIQVTLSPTAGTGGLIFPAGQVPSPQRVELPTPGVIEKYPFDTYRLRTQVSVEGGAAPFDPQTATAIPTAYSVFLDAAGWSYTEEAITAGFTEQERSAGSIARSGPSRLIAMIFIALILAFGVMSVLIIISVLRGRFRPEMSTASWLTAALFALISLRNSMPGSPPLGSWMDVAVYFWVVVVLMVITVSTISILLSRAAAQRANE